MARVDKALILFGALNLLITPLTSAVDWRLAAVNIVFGVGPIAWALLKPEEGSRT
jgi:hypothetical protein